MKINKIKYTQKYLKNENNSKIIKSKLKKKKLYIDNKFIIFLNSFTLYIYIYILEKFIRYSHDNHLI
jgi:hypothetical protein